MRRRGGAAASNAGGDVPLRRSLLLRLLAVTVLVSVCSVAATAWVVVRTTAVAIQKEQGQALADDAKIYDRLLGYAATHPSWDGVGPTVASLAEETKHRIVLRQGEVAVADSVPAPEHPYRPPSKPTAIVNPLAVTPDLSRTGSADRIDPRAVGPFLLPAKERETLRRAASRSAACLSDTLGITAQVTDEPNGRPRVVVPNGDLAAGQRCTETALDAPTRTESRALGALSTLVDKCLDRVHAPPVVLARDFTWTPPYSAPVPVPMPTQEPREGRGVAVPPLTVLPTGAVPDGGATSAPGAVPGSSPRVGAGSAVGATALGAGDLGAGPTVIRGAGLGFGAVDRRTVGQGPRATPSASVPAAAGDGGPTKAPSEDNTSLVNTCISTSRAEQLAPYVAPVALLYVSSPARAATTFFDLSRGNRARIAGGSALVLLLTVTVTTLAGIRLVRPLRALTHAARRMEDGDTSARVRVTGGDELGRLAVAFNSMSERREQLESVRKAMVSDVAHELRTPLSNIRGWLEAAEDGVVAHDQILLTSLLEEALLLQHVIDDLRDLSAADAGELRLRKEWVDVGELLAQTAVAHRVNAEGAGVGLSVSGSFPSPLPGLLLEADPVRLRQAVGNLVSNAIRHTPRGGVVTLRARAEGAHVLIEVADTGGGIAADELPRVFDRFWRAEKSRSRQTGGSGLGLSIVRKLVEAHGGGVGVSSEVGVGSVFTLTLPVERA
ncbi:sensor histidine kinase [Streptomyces sp. NPDC088261]|uniref:sensor histidine kinase n=1 Tax=Streptomyces sp. NPDC088261 TaxID=3365851 RepID=UPI00381CB7D7